ncbi:MAG: MFS transporter, partial [Bacteroidia bacterium]
GTRHYAHADVQFENAKTGKDLLNKIDELGEKTANHIPTQADNDNVLKQILLTILLPAVGFGIIGYLIPYVFLQSKMTDAFLFACVPIIYYYASLYFNAVENEKRPIGAMLAIFVVSIAFWAVFKQNGTALTTWADKYSDRQVSGETAGFLGGLYLTESVSAKPDSFPKSDAHFRVEKVNGKMVKEFGLHPYLKNLPADQHPKGEEKLSLVSTNIFQSVNPGWVIILTPLVVGFFAMLRRRGKEPLVPTKMFWGLIISASSMFCMIAAVYLCGNGVDKSNIGWLIATYGVLTIGELCLSPLGLSLVSKLSPPRITAIMMGGWFLATSIGNKFSGVLATMWDTYDDKQNYFWFNFALLMGAAALIFAMLKQLNKVFEEYTK